ncbi:hypothetical protein [Halomonas cupida]|uniref:hypothetical protein n=1 Tax=Halomonas cupida TaxID=44933 RepID=UPI003A8EEB95
MTAMNIYLKLTTSRRFLLFGLPVLSLFYSGAVALLWVSMPWHPAMMAVAALCLVNVICSLSFFFYSDFPYLPIAGMAFSTFVCPVAQCLIAMILLADVGSTVIVVLPYLVLIYNLVVTGIEYAGIDFQSLPARVTKRPFTGAGKAGLYFDAHVGVLFLSPWRNDNSFFFRGPIRRLQVLLVILVFLYMMLLYPGMSQQGHVGPGLGGLLVLMALVMQPYLLQHLIKLRIVLMKRNRRI